MTVFGSARFKENHRYYKLARKVGEELARSGFATLTGGGPGIMEAANRGAHESGRAGIGLNIVLPHEQCLNPYVDKSIEFHYFFTRMVMPVKYSCAFIVMPGGLGTLDELFEAATLIQCKKIGPFPLILMGAKFWEGMRIWGRFMMTQGVFSKDEIGFGWVTDSPAEANTRPDAVLLTHGHLDDTGRLPLLAQIGWRGPVWATPATRKMASLIIRDSARIQEQDAERESRKRARMAKPPVEPLYSFVTIHGEKVAVRAGARTLSGFSARAGQTNLLSWFEAIAPSKPRVVLTHGKNGPRGALARHIERRFRLKCEIPEMGRRHRNLISPSPHRE